MLAALSIGDAPSSRAMSTALSSSCGKWSARVLVKADSMKTGFRSLLLLDANLCLPIKFILHANTYGGSIEPQVARGFFAYAQ